jgi:gluconolactonase
MENARVLADGLRFPEGPVAMDDGSVIVTELIGKKLTRVAPDGTKTTVAETGGSPNGLAIGPDGALYCTNSGGFAYQEAGPFLIPAGDKGQSQPDDYIGGRIQRIDIATGEVTDLYTECDGRPLKGPNDIVFDSTGGFWFTDLGKSRERDLDKGGLYYAQPDGSSVREVIFPFVTPNGVGLSPDEKTVYVAETETGRLWALDLSGPGQAAGAQRIVAGVGGHQFFDSLGVDAEGNVCVATIINGGITIISPDGSFSHVAPPPDMFDPIVTNICWGGADMKTAFTTTSATQKLIACDWPTAGKRLAFNA